MYAQQRYVTSSGQDHWLFALTDKATGDVIANWKAADHPCYGNGDDWDKVPHPFVDYDSELHNIYLVVKDNINDIKNLDLQTLLEGYDFDTAKEFNYKPMHVGWYDDQGEKVMVDTIPGYIKCIKVKLK